MKERIESMLSAMKGAVQGAPTPSGIKQLLKDLKYPQGSKLKLNEVRAFLEEKLAEYE